MSPIKGATCLNFCGVPFSSDLLATTSSVFPAAYSLELSGSLTGSLTYDRRQIVRLHIFFFLEDSPLSKQNRLKHMHKIRQMAMNFFFYFSPKYHLFCGEYPIFISAQRSIKQALSKLEFNITMLLV